MDGQYLPPKANQDKKYKAAAQATGDEEWPEYPKRKPGHKKRLPIIAAAIVIIIALAVAAYLIFKPNKAAAPSAKNSTASTAPQPAPQVTGGSGTNGSLVHYVSNGQDLNLSFDYPSSWTVTPASNDNSTDQTITLNSPSTTIPAADGTSVTGKVSVTIRPGTATISELNSNSPVAAQNSTQIAYSQPTADQHQYTYLTFIHFSNGSTTPGAFEEVMITGVESFTKAEPVTEASLTGLDPIISASLYRCSTTECTGTGAGVLSIASTTWQNTTLFQQAQALFESLKLN